MVAAVADFTFCTVFCCCPNLCSLMIYSSCFHWRCQSCCVRIIFCSDIFLFDRLIYSWDLIKYLNYYTFCVIALAALMKRTFCDANLWSIQVYRYCHCGWVVTVFLCYTDRVTKMFTSRSKLHLLSVPCTNLCVFSMKLQKVKAIFAKALQQSRRWQQSRWSQGKYFPQLETLKPQLSSRFIEQRHLPKTHFSK